MPQNLFSRLIRYRTTEYRTQRENFLTEAFAAILENDHKFSDKLICCIYKKIPPLYSKKEIETQEHTPYGIPDLIIYLLDSDSDKICKIIFENKWDSPEGKNQLDSYYELIKGNEKTDRLIYLTKLGVEPPDEVKRRDAQPLSWNNIANILKESIEERKSTREEIPWISTEFLNWLKEVGMADNEFELKDLTALMQLRALENKSYSCLSLFKSKAEQENELEKLKLKWSRIERVGGGYWYVWAWIIEENYVWVSIMISYEEKFPCASIRIETKSNNPYRDQHNKKIKEIYKQTKDKLKEFHLYDDVDKLIGADIFLTSLFNNESEVKFASIADWWIKKLYDLRDVINELRSVQDSSLV